MSAMRKPLPSVEDSDETQDIFELIAEILPDRPQWVDSPNVHLGLKTPRQAIADGEEKSVRDMVLGAKYGMFS